MWLDLVALVAGCALLYGGGEALVEASARIGKSLGWSDIVTGLVLVSFGTSAPELFVSVGAALQGFNDLAVGNVVGSNIVNIALVLGLGAIITPLLVAKDLRQVQFPLMMVISVMAVIFLRDDLLTRLEAFALFIVAVSGLLYTLYMDTSCDQGVAIEDTNQSVQVERKSKTANSVSWRHGFLMLAGIGGLVLGAELLICGAVGLSRGLGVSEAVIALTVTALGTSLPEITATLIAVARKNGDIAVGNVVGSNILNLGLVLGVAGMLVPLSSSGISPLSTVSMLLFALFAALTALWLKRYTRWVGVMLIVAYSLYLSVLFTHG